MLQNKDLAVRLVQRIDGFDDQGRQLIDIPIGIPEVGHGILYESVTLFIYTFQIRKWFKSGMGISEMHLLLIIWILALTGLNKFL